MNRLVIGLAVVALGIPGASGVVAGQEPRNPTSQKPDAQRPGDPSPAARTDAQGFINDLTIAGMAEVQLGMIAEQKAANPDVQAFGQMMVTDHTQAGNELKAVASQLNVQPPTQLDSKHKELVDRLSKLQGAEFDREYMSAMVTGHEDVLGKLKARASMPRASAGAGQGAHGAPEPTGAAREGSKADVTGKGRGDDALTEWVAKSMPRVQQHLDRAKQIHQETK